MHESQMSPAFKRSNSPEFNAEKTTVHHPPLLNNAALLVCELLLKRVMALMRQEMVL